MFAEINIQLLEPNVLYLDEKPPKIVKNRKSSKPKESPKKKKTKKSKTKIEQQMTSVKKSKKSQVTKMKIKEESLLNSETIRTRQLGNIALGSDDPLYTSEKEIKMEIDEKNEDNESRGGVEVEDNKYFQQRIPKDDIKSFDEQEKEYDIMDADDTFSIDDDGDDDDEYESKFDCSKEEEEEAEEEDYEHEDFEDDGDDDDDDDDDDDEPLIMLSRNKGRPRKYNTKRDEVQKKPRLEQCHEICKQKCTQKFTEEQRIQMCNLFWSLGEEEKVQFLRKHIRTKRSTRSRRKNAQIRRGCNFCYYLDDSLTDIPNLIRVCRKYFVATLCISNYPIKKALLGYEPEIESELKSFMEQTKESRIRTKEEVQQLLDPETGNLITVDPKAKKPKKSITEGGETKTKKKRIRRKPGDPPPKRNPKPVKCEERCIQKCHTKFSEDERKQICDIFWSMDYKRRKDFILARIETREVETETTPEFRLSNRPPRTYHTRYFLGSGLQGENKRVCKNFFMATLSISRMFITNAIDFADKNTGCYTGVDRRGQHLIPNRIAPERKQVVIDQISSYPTWVPTKKCKTRYLHHSLNIKRMYTEYKELCKSLQKNHVSINVYYRTFHEDFSLSFLSNPEIRKGRGLINLNPNISHYTGEEPGGIWLDPKGDKLDLHQHSPAESFIYIPLTTSHSLDYSSNVTTEAVDNNSPINTMPQTSPAIATTSSALSFNQTLNYAHLIDTALTSSLIGQGAPSMVRNEYNPNLSYDSNVPHAHTASSSASSLFRRL